MTNSLLTSPTPSVDSKPVVKQSWASRALRGLVTLYQLLRAGRPSPCRFTPSCSNYALEALATHGALRGSYLTTRRVLRCNPFGPYGADLVPPARKSR